MAAFATITLLGAVMQAISALPTIRTVSLLGAGRFLQGFGNEGVCICMDTSLTRHWRKSLSFAMSIWIASGFAGDIMSFLVLPNLVTWLDGDWVSVFFVSLSFVGAGFVSCLVVVCCDSIASEDSPPVGAARDRTETIALDQSASERSQQGVALQEALDAVVDTEKLRERDDSDDEMSASVAPKKLSIRATVASLRRGYWVAVALNFFLYGIIWTVTSFATGILSTVYGVSDVDAAMYVSISFGVGLVTTIGGGWLLTRLQRYVLLKFVVVVVAAALLLLNSLLWAVFPDSLVAMHAGLLCLGVSYGIVSSALWGSMGIYSTDATAGVVYSIPYSAFNVSSFAFATLSGFLIAQSIDLALLTWGIGCIVSVVLGILWVYWEREFHINLMNADFNDIGTDVGGELSQANSLSGSEGDDVESSVDDYLFADLEHIMASAHVDDDKFIEHAELRRVRAMTSGVSLAPEPTALPQARRERRVPELRANSGPLAGGRLRRRSLEVSVTRGDRRVSELLTAKASAPRRERRMSEIPGAATAAMPVPRKLVNVRRQSGGIRRMSGFTIAPEAGAASFARRARRMRGLPSTTGDAASLLPRRLSGNNDSARMQSESTARLLRVRSGDVLSLRVSLRNESMPVTALPARSRSEEHTQALRRVPSDANEMPMRRRSDG
jgi:MFS family permease